LYETAPTRQGFVPMVQLPLFFFFGEISLFTIECESGWYVSLKRQTSQESQPSNRPRQHYLSRRIKTMAFVGMMTSPLLTIINQVLIVNFSNYYINL
jgi:hypothetical protein